MKRTVSERASIVAHHGGSVGGMKPTVYIDSSAVILL